MPDQTPASILETLPADICERTGALAAIVLLRNRDGTIGFAGVGCSHDSANEMLSVGIHINLSQHDVKVEQCLMALADQRAAAQATGALQ
ncbi:MAG: hypothetical protein JWQ72_2975 [Polaromonas sp.]|nr:hypothetical protein [Polaromonas sp.]